MTKYCGALEIKRGTLYQGAELLALGAILQIKSKGVMMSVSKSVMFELKKDDLFYIKDGASYMFNKDCVVAICEEV